MVSKVISGLINMDVVTIYKQFQDKNIFIYLADTNEIFDSKKYQGYLRNTETSYFFPANMPNKQMERNIYKLVLFFDKNKCDSDVDNVIYNLLMDVPKDGVISVKPLKSYKDSWSNIKQELKESNKDSAYVNYRVVVIDLETEEIICKTKINCNG